jgi:hypothetical protein
MPVSSARPSNEGSPRFVDGTGEVPAIPIPKPDADVATPILAPIESPTVPRPKQKSAFRMHSGGPSLFGRIAVGTVAVVGVMLGSILGDPSAMTGRRTTETRIEQSATQGEASFVTDVVRRATEVLGPLGLDRDQVLRAMSDASVTVQMDGTRFRAWIHRGGVTLTAQPSLRWDVDWVPHAHISELAYDFTRGSFRAEATGVGPDAAYNWFIGKQANERLRARLPAPMQQPGYDLWADPNIERHLQSLFDLVRTSRPDHTRATRPIVEGMSDPEVSLSFVLPETRTIPLPNGEFTARLEKGTRIEVAAQFDGAVNDPTLHSIRIHFDRELEIAKGDGVERSLFRKIDVRSATIRPGGQIELDYELGAEQVIDGVKGVFLLFVLMSEPRAHLPAIERTRMESARRDVQHKIDSELEPKLIDVIRENDRAIPGLSLSRIFGVTP